MKPWRQTQIAAIAAGSALWLAPALCGQEASPRITVDARLAAGVDGKGPSGLTWLREQFLPALCTAPLPPATAPWRIRFDGSTWQVTAADAPPARGSHMIATVRADGVIATVVEDADGRGSWTIEGNALDAFENTARALRLLSGARRTFDVANLTGMLVPQVDQGSLLGRSLTEGAAACGELTIHRQSHSNEMITGVGHGDGGVTLPAALIYLAWLEAQAAHAVPEPWSLLATAARGSLQDEALRQLTLADETTAASTLQRTTLDEGHLGDLARRSTADRMALAGGWTEGYVPPNGGGEDPARAEATAGSGSLRWMAWLWILLTSAACVALKRRWSTETGSGISGQAT